MPRLNITNIILNCVFEVRTQVRTLTLSAVNTWSTNSPFTILILNVVIHLTESKKSEAATKFELVKKSFLYFKNLLNKINVTVTTVILCMLVDTISKNEKPSLTFDFFERN